LSRVYKIVTRQAWQAAEATGAFDGAAIDVKDGYIHLSTAAQAVDTARLHFQGQTDLILVGFDAEALGSKLIWEPSRGGQMFPHLYGTLPTALSVTIDDLPLDAEGAPVAPALAP
jgi:uncharacterized protein (DUF952 family)